MKKPQGSFLTPGRSLAVILILAAIVRIVYLIAYHNLPIWDQLTVDNYYHHHWAQSIASGNLFGDTTYFRAPFYAFALGAVYAVVGASLWAARLMGLVAGLVSISLTWALGRKVFSNRAASTAALVQALFPVIIYFESELLLDSVFTMLLQATVYFLLCWQQTNRHHHAIAAGLFMGLAVITRPTALALLPAILVYQLVADREFRFRLRTLGTVWLLVPLVILVGAVFIRNIAVASDPVMISSQGGINFYIGNNEEADGVTARLPEPLGNNWRIAEISYLAELESGRKLRPGETSAYWTSKAIDWIGSHPLRFASLYLKKCYYAFTDRLLSNNRNLERFFADIWLLHYNPLSFGWLLTFTVFGLAAGLSGSPRARFFLLLIAMYVALISLFFFNTRFRLPLLPYFILLAVDGLFAIKTVLVSRTKRLLPAVVAASAAGVLSFFPVVSPAEATSPMDETATGLYHFANGNTSEALRYFRQARAVDSTSPEVNLNLGVAFLRSGEADSAQYYLTQEMQFNPERSKTYVNLASLYLTDSLISEATVMAEKAISLRPYDVVANMVLQRAAARSGDVSNDSLLQICEAAAERTGSDIYLLVDAGDGFTARSDVVHAETIYRMALSAQPPPIETDDEAFERNFRNSPAAWDLKRAEAWSRLAYSYALRGAFSNVIDALHRAIALNPDFSDAYVNLITAYANEGDMARADSVYRVAIAKFPENQHLRLMPL
jgi:4-amino-4-deoxy-L-arabinose transferase-like glycosyltransferase